MKACLILNILDDHNNKGKGIILNNEEQIIFFSILLLS